MGHFKAHGDGSQSKNQPYIIGNDSLDGRDLKSWIGVITRIAVQASANGFWVSGFANSSGIHEG